MHPWLAQPDARRSVRFHILTSNQRVQGPRSERLHPADQIQVAWSTKNLSVAIGYSHSRLA
jgi:hypothetical protein